MLTVLALIFSAALTGVIWFVQIVHYPLFNLLPAKIFCAYMHKHQQYTSLIVIPLMPSELVVSVYLFATDPSAWWNITQISLIAIIWASTFGIQMHIHQKLAVKKDIRLIERLTTTNWMRTLAWSGRCVIFAGVLAQ